MPESEGQVLQELQSFLDPSLETDATAPQVQQFTLDDNAMALASQAARPPWYASWVTGALIPAAPALGLLMGIYGGGVELIDWAELGIVLLVLFGPVIGIVWLALFLSHRGRVAPIRRALDDGSAWMVAGPVAISGPRSVTIGGLQIQALHRPSLPAWVSTAMCTAIFADDNTGPQRYGIPQARRMLISITGPDGRRLYPEVGALPVLLSVPSVIASVIVSLAFTAACNAQSQTYSTAASYLRDINASTPCTAKSQPGDDCWKWVQGTVAYDYWYSTSTSNGSTNSTCRATLRWGGPHTQTGDLRTGSIDCTKQLTSTPMPARLDVLKDYVIQVQVGKTTYQTDHWPPLGDSVFTLALIFRIVTVLWIAWPIGHFAWAIAYRARRAMSAPRAGTPSPPMPALGSTT